MLKVFAVFFTVVALSQELALKSQDEDLYYLYKVEKVEKPEDLPIIIRQIKHKNANVQFKLISPNEKFKDEDGKDYVIIKSKEAIDVVPYGLIQRLDKIKFMILWLNLYCEMHADCDKSVLDEELRKMVSSVGKSKEDKYFD